jgi:hypothetical protein
VPTIYHYTEPLVVSSERYTELLTRQGWYSTPTLPTQNIDRTPSTVNINLRDFGVDGTGNNDETTKLQTALTQAASVGGTVQMFGIHPVSATLNVPSGVQLSSLKGVAKIRVAAGFNFPVIKLDNVEARLNNFKIVKDAGAVAGASGHGVYIVGNAESVAVDHVWVDGASAGFYAGGQLGATPGLVKRLVFLRCRATNSNVFGYWIDDVDGFELVGCISNVSALDAVKLRKNTHNVQLTGGYFTGAVGGDGLDAYAGGDSFSINGGIYSGNHINGITIKTDSLSLSDPSGYGHVRNITISNVIAQDNVVGNGLTVHRSSGNPDDPTLPLVSRVSILGGSYDRNANYGIYLLSRQVSVVAPHCSANGLDGIYLEPACMDIDIVSPQIGGNSQTTINTRSGIHLDGTRIRLRGGSSIGVFTPDARNEADIAAGTKQQKYGVNIASTAVEVSYDDVTCLYNATGAINDASSKAHIKAWGATLLKNDQYVTIEGTRSTLAPTLNVEYAMPIWIAQPGAIKAVGIEVTTGVATAVARIGIRRHNFMNAPGAVLGQITIAADTTSTSGIEAALSVAFPYAGLYFVTCTMQTITATLRSASQGNALAYAGSLATAVSATPLMGYQTAATITGALVDAYVVSNRIGAGPLVVLKGA